MRPNLRQAALGGRAEAVEHSTSDCKLEDAVSEELEPLVRLRAVLGPRGMREDLREPFGRQLRDEAAELVRADLVVGLSPDVR
jgi:hypothetical protein